MKKEDGDHIESNIEDCLEMQIINSQSLSSSSMDYSNFEDDFEERSSFDNTLQHNIELINKKKEIIPIKSDQEEHKILIYDSKAKIIKYYLYLN